MRIVIAFCFAVLLAIAVHMALERLADQKYAEGYNDALDSLNAASVEGFVEHSEITVETLEGR